MNTNIKIKDQEFLLQELAKTQAAMDENKSLFVVPKFLCVYTSDQSTKSEIFWHVLKTNGALNLISQCILFSNKTFLRQRIPSNLRISKGGFFE